MQKKREERREKQNKKREERETLMNSDPGNVNWEFLAMIRCGTGWWLRLVGKVVCGVLPERVGCTPRVRDFWYYYMETLSGAFETKRGSWLGLHLFIFVFDIHESFRGMIKLTLCELLILLYIALSVQIT